MQPQQHGKESKAGQRLRSAEGIGSNWLRPPQCRPACFTRGNTGLRWPAGCAQLGTAAWYAAHEPACSAYHPIPSGAATSLGCNLRQAVKPTGPWPEHDRSSRLTSEQQAGFTFERNKGNFARLLAMWIAKLAGLLPRRNRWMRILFTDEACKRATTEAKG
jgi:hypothetical protein